MLATHQARDEHRIAVVALALVLTEHHQPRAAALRQHLGRRALRSTQPAGGMKGAKLSTQLKVWNGLSLAIVIVNPDKSKGWFIFDYYYRRP